MQEKNIGRTENSVYIIENGASLFAKNVPAFSGGVTEGIFADGDGGFIVCIKDADLSSLLNYTRQLEEKGYSKIFDNVIGENRFFSYADGNNLIYVYRIGALNSVKLIAEPFYQFSYNEPFKSVAKPAVITSSVCDRNYYIRLPDNKLVIIDGGWRIEDWSRYEPYTLLKAMYEEMKEICGSQDTVSVPLWIVTHAHTDHVRVLEFLYQMPFADKIVIDRILYNFPDESHLDDEPDIPAEAVAEAQKRLNEWHEKAGKDFPYEDIFYNCPFPVYDPPHYDEICRAAFARYNAVKIKAHDGMKFDMAGVEFNILHTPDDDMPTIYKNMNDTSLVIKMSYKGSSVLWLGDMGVVPGDSCIQMYSEQLKCDAVQVSHHGWGSASEEFFNLLSPKILLWNNSEFGFRYADKYQGYGKTKSSTDLYNMPCVKSNYFCNTIKMQYVDLPFTFKEKQGEESDYRLIASGASDQAFMIRLKNGKLIIINGGWRKEMWDKYDHSTLAHNLFKEMQALSGTEKVTVATWFIADADPNSNRFLLEFNKGEYAGRLKIENFIYNFPDINEIRCLDNRNDVSDFIDLIPSLLGNHIIAEKGKKLHFELFEAKVLYAPDNEGFETLRDATSVFMLEINGKKLIFTGNMTDRISRIILNSGDELDCDAVQVANHGLDNGGVLEFYSRCNAEIILWNCSEYAYRFFNPKQGYGKSAVSTAVYNQGNHRNNYFCDKITPEILLL